ncbi:hypothetical protein SBRY_90169 [Actinacidiphila bryophytorum]|uniref:Uncharacterized protein n=1 Tax=Actinacidiphila bryophytorum TaxID=1436133 RepID=A0A9W4H7R0_9ACTN|nr:hypothetical protein SBRY_90169 [Actinacidiphila bryophytorum]
MGGQPVGVAVEEAGKDLHGALRGRQVPPVRNEAAPRAEARHDLRPDVGRRPVEREPMGGACGPGFPRAPGDSAAQYALARRIQRRQVCQCGHELFPAPRAEAQSGDRAMAAARSCAVLRAGLALAERLPAPDEFMTLGHAPDSCSPDCHADPAADDDPVRPDGRAARARPLLREGADGERDVRPPSAALHGAPAGRRRRQR